MEDNQITRIEKFLGSLENPELQEVQQVHVLQADIHSVGGDNGVGCNNGEEYSCSGTNRKNCTNHSGVCGGSDNRRGCTNLPGPPGVPGVQ